MKILLDVNLLPAWAPVLNRAGFQCTHWRDVGKVDAPDTEVMSWAREHGYVVFTHDMDFGTLLAVSPHLGVSCAKGQVLGVISQGHGRRLSVALVRPVL